MKAAGPDRHVISAFAISNIHAEVLRGRGLAAFDGEILHREAGMRD
jgi:hypothetical protein